MSLSKTQLSSGSLATKKFDASIDCVTELDKIRYCWEIRDFLDYFDFLDENQSFSTKSKNFPKQDDEWEDFFSMKLTVLSNSILVTLNCCFEGVSFSEGTCRLSFINSENVTIKTSDKCRFNLSSLISRNSIDVPRLIWISTLPLLQQKDLFPDNTLIVKCELNLTTGHMKIERFCELKTCQPVLTQYKALLKNLDDGDVIFEFDKEELKAHKAILKARSPVFAAMFKHDMDESRINRVAITEFSVEIFAAMLHFIYTNELNTELNGETGVALLYAASKYHLAGLQKLCEIQLLESMTRNNYEKIRLSAETFKLTDFMKSVDDRIEFLKRNNFENLRQY